MENDNIVTSESVMVNHLCFCLSAARMLLEFCERYEKFKYKDIKLTPETRKMLQRDYDWTNIQLAYLRMAKDGYNAMDQATQHLCNNLDAKIKKDDFNAFQMDTNDMLAIGILYQSKIWEHPEVRKEIHDFIFNIGGKPQDDIKAVYTHYMNHANHL